MKRWKISTPDSEAVEVICKRTELSQLCAEIMTSRGVTQIDDLAEFFNSSELSDPFELKDMDKAVEAINNTLEGFGLICVYGDYDCDGVTATVVLYNYLECIGANVMYYIPEREEGYGLRGSVKLEKRFSKFGIFVEPFIRYWHIQNSEEAYAQMGPYVITIIEPKNETREYGLKIGLTF